MSRIIFSGAVALGFAFSTPALSHVAADPAEATPDSHFRTALRVPHGCSGQPTTALRVAIPDGIVSAKPQAKPGWQAQVESRKLSNPIDIGHGRKSDSVPAAVSWSGGSLPNDHFDEFGLVLKLPDAPGTQFALAVAQVCGNQEISWNQVAQAGQDSHGLERPAALIRISGEPAASAGNIRIRQPFARATPAKVGGVFMTLQNSGVAADRLVKAESPVAASVELHTHIKDGDAMRMRPVSDIPVPAGGTTKLEPGGYHIMLIGLKQPLKEGERVPLTLTFEKGGSITIEVPVQKAGAAGGHNHH